MSKSEDPIFAPYVSTVGNLNVTFDASYINRVKEHMDKLVEEEKEVPIVYIYPVLVHTTKHTYMYGDDKSDKLTERAAWVTDVLAVGTIEEDNMEKQIPELKQLPDWKKMFIQLKDIPNYDAKSDAYEYPIFCMQTSSVSMQGWCEMVRKSYLYQSLGAAPTTTAAVASVEEKIEELDISPTELPPKKQLKVKRTAAH